MATFGLVTGQRRRGGPARAEIFRVGVEEAGLVGCLKAHEKGRARRWKCSGKAVERQWKDSGRAVEGQWKGSGKAVERQ